MNILSNLKAFCDVERAKPRTLTEVVVPTGRYNSAELCHWFDWCNNNVGKENWQIGDRLVGPGHVIKFTHREDAIAFRLKFGV